MAALAGNPTSVWGPFDWTLLFARQPEPDLEFTEEELDQTVATKARAPLNPHKKPSGGKPILWVLILILVGGIAYVSMEPEMMTELLSPYLGESTPPPPMTTMRPKPAVPAPAPPPIAPSVPAPQPAPSPSAQAPTPSAPVAPSPTDAAPAAPPVAPPTTARPAAPEVTSLSPMFGEGQKVTVTADEIAPGGSISLTVDSSSSKPGPIVRPGTSLTVMDGDLQPGGWMYLVRTDDGLKGWVSEKRLRLKF